MIPRSITLNDLWRYWQPLNSIFLDMVRVNFSLGCPFLLCYLRTLPCRQGCGHDVHATEDPGPHSRPDPSHPEGRTGTTNNNGGLWDGHQESVQVRVQRRHRKVPEVDGRVRFRLVSRHGNRLASVVMQPLGSSHLWSSLVLSEMWVGYLVSVWFQTDAYYGTDTLTPERLFSCVLPFSWFIYYKKLRGNNCPVFRRFCNCVNTHKREWQRLIKHQHIMKTKTAGSCFSISVL